MSSRILRSLALPVLALALTGILIVSLRSARARSALTSPVSKEEKAAVTRSTVRSNRIAAEGRLVAYPGAEVVVSTDYEGIVAQLYVAEGDRVRKGQVLAEIRAEDLVAEIAEQRAKLAEAEVEIRYATLDQQRAERLRDEKVGTVEAADRGRNRRELAEAQKETALAATHRLEVLLDKATLRAPIGGVVTAREVHAGEHVARGAHLLSIVDLRRTRIEAEVDEFDVGRIVVGAPVTIRAEGYGEASWRGRVEELPSTVVPRRLKSLDPGRPSDVRVLLVKVALEEGVPLRLGQRAEILIMPPR